MSVNFVSEPRFEIGFRGYIRSSFIVELDISIKTVNTVVLS